MNPKFRAFAEKLRSEAERFADYKTIEERTTELGFPTSVRTLRFYVSEGVLPPPRKAGKASVYPEEWILNTLLAIHLMKTRFSRSLAEIKDLLEALTEDPETLADKLTELYDLCYGDGSGRLSPVEQRWIVDRFFGALSGQQPLPGCPARMGQQAGQRAQPGEVLLSDIFKELDDRSRGGADRESADRACASSSGRTRDEARHLEGIFIRSFESAVRSLEQVYHPREERFCALRGAALRPVIGDAYQEVARMLVEHRLFDRDVFDCMPLNKSTRFDITEGLITQETKISVVGVSWSPLPDLVSQGRSDRALTEKDLCEILARFTDTSDCFTYVGVLATCGLSSQVRQSVPTGENSRVALIEYDDTSGWRVYHRFPQDSLPLVAVFDPEPPEDKTERLSRRLLGLDSLHVRGGFVDLSELEKDWDVSPAIMDAATRRVTAKDSQLEVTTVRNRRILKRARYVV